MADIAPELLWNLLDTQGSPLLVGSRTCARQQFSRLKCALPAVAWMFAIKSNNDPELLNTLAAIGCGFDIASYSEWVQAQRALRSVKHLKGPLSILHSHPCKSPTDIKMCFRAGQRFFVFDCASELNKLALDAPQSSLLIRLNVPNRSGRVAFSHRFGAELKDLIPLAIQSQNLGLSIEGIAFHIGSQAVDPCDFETALIVARKAYEMLVSHGIKLKVLDIGGGFPISYRGQPAPLLEDYCRSIAASIDRIFSDHPLTIIAEPGRILCGQAVSLIATVIGKQRRQGKRWYTIDDGRYGSFSGRYFSESTFDFIPYQRSPKDPVKGATDFFVPNHAELDPSRSDWLASIEPSMIVGPSCDGGDIVATDYPLPELEIGDALVVPNMGAYTFVSASEFNGIPRAKRLWLD